MTVLGDDGLARPVWAATDPLMKEYYDTEWGMPVRDERGLFERLSLEAFQSGLSWATILRKRPAFRAAFDDFDPDAVAAYDERDVERLMADAGIVRNRRKVDAAIANARATVATREQGGLEAFIWSFRPEPGPAPRTTAEVPTASPESLALSRALKKAGFAHVGPTTMYALMEAIGLVDDHLEGCHRRGASH
jgi:DNA-3-methyladenine glycosylase I